MPAGQELAPLGDGWLADLVRLYEAESREAPEARATEELLEELLGDA